MVNSRLKKKTTAQKKKTTAQEKKTTAQEKKTTAQKKKTTAQEKKITAQEKKIKPRRELKQESKKKPVNRHFANRQRHSRGKSLPREVKSDMNVPELHKIAKSLGIAYAGLNKAKLVKKINNYL